MFYSLWLPCLFHVTSVKGGKSGSLSLQRMHKADLRDGLMSQRVNARALSCNAHFIITLQEFRFINVDDKMYVLVDTFSGAFVDYFFTF